MVGWGAAQPAVIVILVGFDDVFHGAIRNVPEHHHAPHPSESEITNNAEEHRNDDKGRFCLPADLLFGAVSMCIPPIMQISGSLGTMSEVGMFPQLTSWNSPPAATDSEDSEKGG